MHQMQRASKCSAELTASALLLPDSWSEQQGGGVTTNYRTKPNPLLQYMQPGPTFPMHPSQPRHQHAPQMSAGSMGAFPLKGPSGPGPGPAGGLMSTMHPGSQVAPWMHQELAPSMYRGGGERRSTATRFYSAVRSSLTLLPTQHLFLFPVCELKLTRLLLF